MSNSQSIYIQQGDVRLGVDFTRVGDRWHHKIVATTSDGPQTLLESVEGDADEIWPPSPALQEVDLHELANGPAILAVGMAGTSHWSGSYSTETLSDNRQSIKFDLACRLKQTPPVDPSRSTRLGSSYLVHSDPTCDLQISNNELVLSVDSHVISVSASDNTGVHSWDDTNGKRIQFTPSEVSTQNPQTVRWAFNLQFRQS